MPSLHYHSHELKPFPAQILEEQQNLQLHDNMPIDLKNHAHKMQYPLKDTRWRKPLMRLPR